ncbi:MAG: OmpA family protein [Pseudomonadota bacterium]
MDRSKAQLGAAAAAVIVALAAAAFGMAAAAEAVTRLRAQTALSEAGHDWARVEADGLRLTLLGEPPDGAAARDAAEAAEAAAPMASLDASRLVRPPQPAPARPEDETAAAPGGAAEDAEGEVEAVAPAEKGPAVDAPDDDEDAAGEESPAAAAPAVVMRDLQDRPPAPGQVDAPLVIAFAPGRLDIAGPAHPDLIAALTEAARAMDPPADIADGTLPRDAEDRDQRLILARAALSAMALAREARAEVRAGLLEFHAVVADDDARAALEDRLRTTIPPSAALLMDISAPPPVFSPFRFVVGLGEGGVSILGCDMTSAEERARVLAALQPLGGPEGPAGTAACRLGVGAPSAAWSDAAVAGVEALGAVGVGRFELVDMEARLVALPPADATRLDAAGKALAAALPAGFSLRTFGPPAGPRLPRRGEDGAGEVEWFAVRRDADGSVRLSGAAPDEPSRRATVAFAGAKLGGSALTSVLAEAEAAPPPAWRRASLAAVEALTPLASGEASFDGARLTVTGRTLDPADAARVEAALDPAREAGAETRSEVIVDVAALAAQLPLPPAECLDALSRQVERAPIAFAPGSVEIDPKSAPALDALAGILRRCAEIGVEIQGHTDSQGRESTNAALSQSRATAVLDALFARGAPLARLTARGYGEAQPIAPNDTEEGRARNRRIAFAPAPAETDR